MTFKFRSHEIRNYETTIDLAHDKSRLDISTSVSSLLLIIQRVEIDVTFYNKLHFMVQFLLTMFLWPTILYINEPDIYILPIYANSKG